MGRLILLAAALAATACVAPFASNDGSGGGTQTGPASRGPSASASCEDFNKLAAADKLQLIQSKHLASAAAVDSDYSHASSYVASFIGGGPARLKYAEEALVATNKFLIPSLTDATGYKALRPTMTRSCDFFEEPTVKMVHALGTLAPAHMILYTKMNKLDEDNDVVEGSETDNPWSGLFDPSRNKGGIPVMLRFSIANPVAHSIEVHHSSFLLEFIPGLGLKFLVDGKKSVDLLAMESLAGQGRDQNYFKYEFSPDFSAHAPIGFNTADDKERLQMKRRYDQNRLNAFVMGQVGKRFAEVIPLISNVQMKELEPHSNVGPHPFVISIQEMAAVDKSGHDISPNSQRRPWRLVFLPALDNVDEARKKQIEDSSAYVPGKIETDFRSKLAKLKSGDRVFYVVGETKTKARYLIGEIVLDATPIPSEFADREFFIQHKLEWGRRPGNIKFVVDP